MLKIQLRDIMNNLCDNKCDNFVEMDKFLEKYDLPKATLKEMENIKSPVFIKEMEFIIKQLPIKKFQT